MEVIITEYALNTVNTEFNFLKESASERVAHKFKDEFVHKVDSILPFYLGNPESRFLPTKNKNLPKHYMGQFFNYL